MGKPSAPEELCYTAKNLYHYSFSHPSPKGPMAFYQGNCALEKRKSSEISEITGHWFWLALIPGDPKHLCGPPVKVCPYGGQVIDGVLAQDHSTVVLVGSWSCLAVISPVLECIISTDINSNWQNPHIGSLSCGLRTIMVGKPKWKSLELLQHIKNSKPKAIPNPGRIAEISATVKDSKNAGMVTASPFNSSIWPWRRQMDLRAWQWIIVSLIRWWF